MKVTAKTRIYIAGCAGMLGDAVYQRFSGISQVQATDINVSESWLGHADVRVYSQLKQSIEEFHPDVIMNLAAITDLERCEREPENTWLTNTLGAENLGLIANRVDATYVYISTAGVFDGRQATYSDFDTPNPLNCYGKSKYYGETFVRQHVQKHYVIRAGWMMGGGPAKDKKFLNKIYRQIRDGRRELFAVDDKVGTPTYTVDFARGLHLLLESEMYGLYNQGGEGLCSRYEVAQEFVRLLGLEDEVAVKKVDSSFFEKEYFAPRPASEALVNLKLRARGLNVMRDWRTCLGEYCEVFVRELGRARSEKHT